ncbi:MAG TPA: dsRBD fold-containing protein [Actinomycetes bacterium]|nr:dsRBD fold-containing protein [Actinomycetes bacterium]
MKASVGDPIVIVSNQLDRPVREGEILEVRGPGGSPPYLVRWADTGHTGLCFPGPDARIEHRGGSATGTGVPTPRTEAEQGPVLRWTVDVQVSETGDDTTARVVLRQDTATQLEARGRAHRNPSDDLVPQIGAEVAVARALRRLADQLLSVAASDIAEVEGHPVQLPR